MNQAAETIERSAELGTSALYEQPLNERMRTFLRLEFLYQQLKYYALEESSWSSRGSISTLLDIVAIMSRGDVRGDVLKELERQLYVMDRLQKTQDVDNERLSEVITQLQELRGELNAVGPKYLQELRDNEFLNAIRHRSSIPGGTCAFDLPEYTHWLRQGYARRSADVGNWMATVQPLCNSVNALLWLVRYSKQPSRRIAVNGVYQHSMNRDNTNALIRIILPSGTDMYPEISGGQHRFTVRLMQWDSTEKRPVQIKHDVEFKLTVC